MKTITKTRNVKAQVSLPTKANPKLDNALKHPPALKPKNKRAK